MAVNQGNSLSASSLGPLMVSSLPKAVDSKLKNPWDATALFCHVCMLSVGFRLIGLGEDHKIDASSEVDDTKPLPDEWNASPSSNYAFRYAHSQSSLQFLIKVGRLGSKAVVNGLAIGDDKVTSFDIPVKDYLSESSFPFTIPADTAASEASQSVQTLFISPGRIGDLSALVKINILQKLAPGLNKEGWEELAHAASPHARASTGREEGRQGREDASRRPEQDPLPPLVQPRPFHDPLTDDPRRPYPAGDLQPPGFEDEYEILRPPGRGGFTGGERRPLNIGERDLYPPGLAPHDPLRIGGPSGGFRGGGGGGGMHPTFDDPMFGADGGVGGYNPRAPPGARYDPVGPGDGPPNLRGGPRFPGAGPGSGGGGPPNPFGGFGSNDFI